MTWQDIVITACIIAFGYALVPQVIQGFREKRGVISTQTSLITCVGMLAMSVMYFTLNLYFSALLALITGVLWEILFLQKMVYA
jgi:hypothetical protein